MSASWVCSIPDFLNGRHLRLIIFVLSITTGLSNPAVTWAQSAASSKPGFLPSSSRILAPFSAQVVTETSDIRVGLLSSNGGVTTVKAGLAGTGLLDADRISVISNSGTTPTLAQLQPFDAILVWTNDAFDDPAAAGDTLAAYVDYGGSVVIATYAFSKTIENNWWIGGRFLSPGYSPFQVSTDLESVSGIMSLSTVQITHAVFDGFSSTDTLTYTQNENYTNPPLNKGAHLLARDTAGNNVIAYNRAHDIVGISIFPGNNTLSPDNPRVSRLFANALIFACTGGFAVTTPNYINTNPIDITGLARDMGITAVNVQVGGVFSSTDFDPDTNVFSLQNVNMSPRDNLVIAQGMDATGALVAADTIVVVLDQATPAIIAGPNAIATTDSSATIFVETDEPVTVRVAFSLSANAVNSTTTVDIDDFQKIHRIVLPGLLPNMTYYFKVEVTDRAGNSSGLVPPVPRTFLTRRENDTIAPRIVQFPAAVTMGPRSALITATTDEVTLGFVQFVANDSTLQVTEVPGPEQFFIKHRITLTGLTLGTRYFFRMRFVDPANNETVAPFQSFTTPSTADTTSPNIASGPAVLLATAARTIIVYDTDEPSDTEVLVHAIGSTDTTKRFDPALVTDHRTVITSLQMGVDYAFRVRSRDSFGNMVESKRRTFKTGEADTLAPVIVEGPVVGYNGGSVIVMELNTDEPATVRLDVAPIHDLSDIITIFGDVNVTTHRITITNLEFGTPYRFLVTITDLNGNFMSFPPGGLSAKQLHQLVESRLLFRVLQAPGLPGRFTTNRGPDNQAPVVLAGPTIVSHTSNSLTVTWQTDELSNSVVEYGETSDFGQTVTGAEPVTTHLMTLTNLFPGTTYNYQISSRDVVGNGPTQGPLPTLVAAAITAGQPDIAPPVISNVLVSGITDDHVIITWTTDEPADSFVDFDITSTGFSQTLGNTNPVTAHTVTLTNLAPGKVYFFRIRSLDVAGNGPRISETASFTTSLNGDGTPPSINGIVVRPGFRSASFSWLTDEPSNSFVKVINGIDDTLAIASGTLVTDHGLTVTDTIFLPSGAINYRVIVGATDPSGNIAEGAPQVFTTLATPDVIPPATPGGLSAIPGNGAVLLRWNRNTESDFAGYQIFRISATDTIQVQSGVTDTTFLDDTVINGTSIGYFLTAIDAAIPTPNTSAPSVSASTMPSSATVPSSPALSSPVNRSEVSLKPILVTDNASPGTNGGTLTYTFAVYADSALTQPVFSTTGVAEGSPTNPTHVQVIDPAVVDSVILQDGTRYWWRVQASDGIFDGAWSIAQSFTANISIPTAVEDTPGNRLPATFSLAQNFPNPFNPTTSIRYALPAPGAVTLTVYNILGQKVHTLVDHQRQDAGFYVVDWNGRNAAGGQAGSGVYFYRLEVRGDTRGEEVYSDVRKMVLVK